MSIPGSSLLSFLPSPPQRRCVGRPVRRTIVASVEPANGMGAMMSQTMTTRERVERAMALEETDRVPVYDLLRHDGAFEHFSGKRLPPPADDADTLAELHRIAATAVGNRDLLGAQ